MPSHGSREFEGLLSANVIASEEASKGSIKNEAIINF